MEKGGQVKQAAAEIFCGSLFCITMKIKKEKQFSEENCFYGAGDEARTRYLHLGKVALYQMSYTRIS